MSKLPTDGVWNVTRDPLRGYRVTSPTGRTVFVDYEEAKNAFGPDAGIGFNVGAVTAAFGAVEIAAMRLDLPTIYKPNRLEDAGEGWEG